MSEAKNTYYLGEADLAALIKYIENEGKVEWDRFLDYAERMSVETGGVVMRQFEYERDIFVLTEGQLEIRVGVDDDDPGMVIATVSPIAVVGEQSFLDEGARSASVVASQPSTVYRMTFDAFEDLCASAPDLGRAFLFDVARSLSLRCRVHEA